jgi:hypothetical protein
MSQPQEEERRVVPFAVPPGRMGRRLVEDADGRGAILLFTGVRYERCVRDPAVTAPQDAPPPPRDPRREN